MKHIITFTMASICLAWTASAQQTGGNKLAQDKAAIKSMCGCQEVTFEYTETFPADTSYKPKGYHKITDAVEYVTVAAEDKNRIILQHLLIADSMVIKHWTEDWLYENQQLLAYDKDDAWKKVTLPATQVKGQWTQKVYGVDDEPRYEGSATWVHADGRHYWESASDAPLPRREYTTRKDYNVLHRTNHHEITATGSIHEQDNLKVVRANGTDKIIVGEKGLNTYNRTDENRCKLAKAWWEQNQAFWAVVRKSWDNVYGSSSTIHLRRKVNNEPLYKVMAALEEKALRKELTGAALEKEVVATLQQFATNKELSLQR
ncbi:hypothetical protein HGH93_25035 [Chitinophaga polysaccharea]|uniref:DUF6607 family protein n=1 Tax=Chitinophaga TaxID=79328 RepID=UPI0014557678|nr:MULTISPECIES: DUF6607 family protein [Chitinophaga]NLR61390.1 hypothetical protein [Chitinophaga polysaccharea]NLU95225.1 hypothetical protein [Chitinophaga sp. Ak27]